MLQKTSHEFRTFFLLQFTKELIKNSFPEEFVKPQQIFEVQPKITSTPQEMIKRRPPFQSRKMDSPRRASDFIRSKKTSETLSYFDVFSPRKSLEKRTPIKEGFYIPEMRLPQRLNYIRPYPINLDVDLGNLNSLLRDSAVKVIECRGPDEKIIVRGDMGIKPTGIILSANEIDEVINKFSIRAKIPVVEGIFRVAFGKLIFTAIVSEVVSPKFIIRKMVLPIKYEGVSIEE